MCNISYLNDDCLHEIFKRLTLNSLWNVLLVSAQFQRIAEPILKKFLFTEKELKYIHDHYSTDEINTIFSMINRLNFDLTAECSYLLPILAQNHKTNLEEISFFGSGVKNMTDRVKYNFIQLFKNAEIILIEKVDLNEDIISEILHINEGNVKEFNIIRNSNS